MANTQLGGAETIDSYRKKIMTILKKSGRTPVSDRDLLPSAAPTAAGLPISAKRCRNSAKRVRSVNAAAAMFPPQTWATIRQRSSG